MNFSHHVAALNLMCDLECTIQRIDEDAVDEATDRTTLQTELACSSPIEMKNDEKERAGLGSVASIGMMWAKIPSTGIVIQERDRVIIGALDFRVRKVKAWPMVNPEFYELHVEDES